MRLRRQSIFSNNNLGIEEAPQLQDESGPRRIDQSPEGRIIDSNVRFGSARHGFMWGSTRLILARFGAWPMLGSLGSALVRDSGWAGLAIEHLHWGWAGNIDESGSS